MTKEENNKYKQYLRLLISYNDFQQSIEIADTIIEEEYSKLRSELKGKEGQRIRKIWEGLNCSMVIAYCRPFSFNDKKSSNRIPDLPSNILKCLTEEERELHTALINERNTMLAHSDSEAWNMQPTFIQLKKSGRKILYPASFDTRAPLLEEVVSKIHVMASKLREETFRRRMILEKEISHLFPIEEIDEKKLNYKQSG